VSSVRRTVTCFFWFLGEVFTDIIYRIVSVWSRAGFLYLFTPQAVLIFSQAHNGQSLDFRFKLLLEKPWYYSASSAKRNQAINVNKLQLVQQDLECFGYETN